MHDLILKRPDNVRGPFGTYVNHDVFHISERLEEISPHLLISAHDTKRMGPFTWNFTISELVPGGERLVFRAEELDARIVTHVQYIMSVPWEKRFAAMEAEEAKWAEECHQKALDEMYENMGGEMRHQLYRCGFAQAPTIYRPMNATARRHRAEAAQLKLAIAQAKVILPPGVAA